MRLLLSFSLIILLAACGDDAQTSRPSEALLDAAADSTTVSQRFIVWLDAEYARELEFKPLTSTRLGDKTGLAELDDVSEQGIERELQWRKDSVARMRSEFDRNELNDQGQLSWDLWEISLQEDELNNPFRRHQYIFGRNGPQTALLSSLISYHRVDSVADIDAYIARLNESSRYLLQYLERAQLAAADGIRAPYFDYDRAMSEIERVLSGAPFTERDSSPIWADILGKIEGLQASATINNEQAQELTDRAREALLNSFKPAYEEIYFWLRTDRENVPVQARGAWSLPDGDAYYAARLQTMTTLDMSAAQIHQLGLEQVARIQAEMESIMRQVNFEGSLQDFFSYMRTDDKFFNPNTDQGRADYLALAEQLLETTYRKLPDYFGILPKAGLQVRRVEAFREQSGGAAHYRSGTADGSRPGTFYVHLSDMSAAAVNRLENLAYHEGVPGHHMQRSIQQELQDIPRFRLSLGFTAYTEGWGLYAEQLGKEMGGYQDPYADFGRLSGEIWRAVRLVVDTGIHALHWTEDQAVAFALQNSPRPEVSVRSEIERYFNNPGQATAYMIGMLKIQELRLHAESELGSNFDVRGFHDLVLGSGPIPLAVLERRVNQWITEQVN